jgi:hypothetical protein
MKTPLISFAMIAAMHMGAACAGPADTRAKVISIADARCASMHQKHPTKAPSVRVSYGIWSVQWPPQEGSRDYLVASVNGRTLKPVGCVMYSLAPSIYQPATRRCKGIVERPIRFRAAQSFRMRGRSIHFRLT